MKEQIMIFFVTDTQHKLLRWNLIMLILYELFVLLFKIIRKVYNYHSLVLNNISIGSCLCPKKNCKVSNNSKNGLAVI